MKIRHLSKFGLVLLYFSRFVLTAVPAQLFLMTLFLRKPRAPRIVYFYLASCTAYFLFVVSIGSSVIPLRNILFYFSFLPPFLVMLSARHSFDHFAIADGFLVAVCVLTVAEAIVINTPWGANLWFVPGEDGHRTLLFNDWYQRPLGVASTASSSANLVVFSLVLSDVFQAKATLFCRRNIWAVLALIVLASGQGFAMFVIYLMVKLVSVAFRTQAMGWVSKVSLPILVALLLVGATGYLSTEGFTKFSFEYALILAESKAFEISAMEPRNLIEAMLGGQVSRVDPVFATSTDFGYKHMLSAIGAVGVVLVLSAPLLFFRSLWVFAVPTIFFYLSFVHYPALSSPPGAVLFALYLYMMSSHRRVGRGQMEALPVFPKAGIDSRAS